MSLIPKDEAAYLGRLPGQHDAKSAEAWWRAIQRRDKHYKKAFNDHANEVFARAIDQRFYDSYIGYLFDMIVEPDPTNGHRKMTTEERERVFGIVAMDLNYHEKTTGYCFVVEKTRPCCLVA